MAQGNKDIQPQAEPYIVKSHDIHVDADYADWIADIKSRYRSAQVKAAVKVNAEKISGRFLHHSCIFLLHLARSHAL